MECDLRRLRFAIDTVGKATGEDWRVRYRIAGWKVDEPLEDPDSDEAFNDQLRGTLGIFRRK